jgi:hypothetical protein
MRLGGVTLGVVGAVGALCGAALPWAIVTIFGIPLALPGLLTYGAICAVSALLGLLTLRAFPLVACVAGAICSLCALTTRQTVVRDMMSRVITVERAIAPVNLRLAQVALDPIEPFQGIGPAAKYLGPGAFIAALGGIGLATGGGFAFAGARLRRSCGVCGNAWPASRDPNFCPHCGTLVTPQPLCRHCHAPLVKGDKFCAECGSGLLGD